MQIATKVVCKMAEKRISARQQLLHSSTVITAVMKLMDKKLFVMSGRSVSTKKQEEIKCDSNKFSKNLRQLIALDDDQNTVEKMKTFIERLDAGVVLIMHPTKYLDVNFKFSLFAIIFRSFSIAKECC